MTWSGSGQPAPRADVPADAADEVVHPEQSTGGANHAATESAASLRSPPGSGRYEVRETDQISHLKS